jgi:SHS2 domain-containing protein
MKGPRKGKSAKKVRASRPSPRPAPVQAPATRARENWNEELADGLEESAEDSEIPGGDWEDREANTGRPEYGADTEAGRHLMELLEKEQEYGELPRSRRPRSRAERRFEIVEHTADVGIRAFGETLPEAFENAALGMFNIITEPARVAPSQDFEVIVEGEDLKALLHEWLSQLLILSQVDGMLFSGFKVALRPVEHGYGLTGQVLGETADPKKHVYKTEIKAVTRHMLEVRERPPMVKVLFDI